jgi:hypothetical protein
MSTVRGTYHNGQVIFDGPAPEWPDGAEVRLELVDPSADEDDPEGLLGTDPESIARWLAFLDQLQPFLSEEDEARWRQARQEQWEWEKANAEKRARQIEDLFR